MTDDATSTTSAAASARRARLRAGASAGGAPRLDRCASCERWAGAAPRARRAGDRADGAGLECAIRAASCSGPTVDGGRRTPPRRGGSRSPEAEPAARDRCASAARELLRRSADVHYEEERAPGLRAHPRRPRPRRGAHPAAARPARARSRRSTCAPAGARHRLGAGRARAHDDRRRGRLPPPRPRARLPQQPLPARPDLVLARAARRPARATRCSRPSPRCSRRCAQAGRAQTVRRSIHLTPFGEDFCKTCCLPVEHRRVRRR